jgi:hypothetical protein
MKMEAVLSPKTAVKRVRFTEQEHKRRPSTVQSNMYFLCIIQREKYTVFRVAADRIKNIAAPRNITFPVIIDYAVGWGSIVGIGIRCRLDGPGIDSRWGRETFHTRQTCPWTHPTSYTMDNGSFPA